VFILKVLSDGFGGTFARLILKELRRTQIASQGENPSVMAGEGWGMPNWNVAGPKEKREPGSRAPRRMNT